MGLAVTAWHAGRTFYACPCGARDESLDRDPPPVLACWHCGKADWMTQWVPPAVKREREASAALSAREEEGRLL